ncbi:hypothetical protein KC345_g192 [Hortaea werneckii]|nr:hypothetical protein KC345_g192 [Hortaea werneckii]
MHLACKSLVLGLLSAGLMDVAISRNCFLRIGTCRWGSGTALLRSTFPKVDLCCRRLAPRLLRWCNGRQAAVVNSAIAALRDLAVLKRGVKLRIYVVFVDSAVHVKHFIRYLLQRGVVVVVVSLEKALNFVAAQRRVKSLFDTRRSSWYRYGVSACSKDACDTFPSPKIGTPFIVIGMLALMYALVPGKGPWPFMYALPFALCGGNPLACEAPFSCPLVPSGAGLGDETVILSCSSGAKFD